MVESPCRLSRALPLSVDWRRGRGWRLARRRFLPGACSAAESLRLPARTSLHVKKGQKPQKPLTQGGLYADRGGRTVAYYETAFW